MRYRNRFGKTAAGVAGGVILAVAVAAGVFHAMAGAGYVSTDDAYVDGRVHAVSAKVSGMVRDVRVTDNQPVKKGDVLVEIDPPDYDIRVREAEAVLAAEEARLAESKARINAARAFLTVKSVACRQAVLDKSRAGRLFAQGVLSKERLEKAQTALDLARAEMISAGEGEIQARAARQLAEALVVTRKASLSAARLNLGYTRIVAPADGFVTKKSVEPGNMIQPGQPLMAIVSLDDVWVLANYKETQLERVHPGQEVLIKVDTYPGHDLKGKVESLMAGTGSAFSLFPPENALGNYVKIVQRIPVRIALDKSSDPRHLLRVGMSAVARIRIKED
ncbi:MAG: HlyD family secretion protein [Candidatus Omnitrophota bacterium]